MKEKKVTEIEGFFFFKKTGKVVESIHVESLANCMVGPTIDMEKA